MVYGEAGLATVRGVKDCEDKAILAASGAYGEDKAGPVTGRVMKTVKISCLILLRRLRASQSTSCRNAAVTALMIADCRSTSCRNDAIRALMITDSQLTSRCDAAIRALMMTDSRSTSCRNDAIRALMMTDSR